MKHLNIALLCAVYLINGVDPSRKTEQRNKRNVVDIRSKSAASKTKLRTIWPAPDYLVEMEDAKTLPPHIITYGSPTPSPSRDTKPAPTASPGTEIDLIPTPSPTGATSQPTPSPSGNSGLNPTPSPSGDTGNQPTPRPTGNTGLSPTPGLPTSIGLAPTPLPFTSIVSNRSLTSSPTTVSRSVKVTPPSVTFSTTAQNGAEKAESLNLCLVFYCCLIVLMNL